MSGALFAHTSSRLNQMRETGIARKIGRENIFAFTGRMGESAIDAYDAAEKWLAEQSQEPSERKDGDPTVASVAKVSDQAT